VTTRRELIKRTAVAGGLAWAAPAIMSAGPAGAVTCTCHAYKFGNNNTSCLAFTSAVTTGGSNCTAMNTAWVSALTAGCTTYASDCSNFPLGFSVTWTGTGGDDNVSIVLPVGATPLFLGVRYDAGCAWLSGCGTFASDCSTITNEFSGTCSGGGCMTWTAATRTFFATVAGWTGGDKVNGISHAVVAFSLCGS